MDGPDPKKCLIFTTDNGLVATKDVRFISKPQGVVIASTSSSIDEVKYCYCGKDIGSNIIITKMRFGGYDGYIIYYLSCSKRCSQLVKENDPYCQTMLNMALIIYRNLYRLK